MRRSGPVVELLSQARRQSGAGSEALAVSCNVLSQQWRTLHSNSESSRAAFAFDIDGVLVKGNSILDQAKRALARLYDQGGSPRYPICFLTNGGGVLEAEKARQLSQWLDIKVHPEQVVLSHTPFKTLSHLHTKRVLLVGRHDLRVVAKSYGFQNVITTSELAALNPDAVPHAKGLLGTTKPRREVEDFGTEASPIDAILVFSDSSNWYLDLQLMYDLITSGGVIGRGGMPQGSKGLEVYFSNPDFVFANEFATPRFGQGALAIALQALLNEDLSPDERQVASWKVFGKPNPEPYLLAAKVIADQATYLGWKKPSSGRPGYDIFMIGDNPASDIAGARNTGRPWQSILVRTGVFRGPGSNSDSHPADLVVNDVEEAVDAALSGNLK